jgi:hypothetical protein
VFLLAAHVARAQTATDESDAGVDDGAYTPPSPLRGLLAGEPFDREPMKSVYFFPGDTGAYNENLYTAHPTLQSDQHWNTDPDARRDVIERMIAANVNTITMSYWGDDMQQWSPMALDPDSVPALIEAVNGKPIVIVPSLESGFDSANPSGPHWRLSEDFPYANGEYSSEALAPKLLARLRTISELFRDHRGAWAQMYDRDGRARYVVHVMQAWAEQVPQVAGKSADQVVAEAFDAVAARFYDLEGIPIGFTLDVTDGPLGSYSFTPSGSGAPLEHASSVLAIHLFLSEARAGRVQVAPPFEAPFDNNVSNLSAMIDGKIVLLELWRITGLPVVYDVASGFDGRFVWAGGGSGFWGDNYNYTSDDWRNLESEQKNKRFIGVALYTWNGYTEGYAVVPTVEHGDTIYDWLGDMYSADPRDCHHVAYEDGHASHLVSGDICLKWEALGASRGVLGEPTSDELTSTRARYAHFEDGDIFAAAELGVHDVYGAAAREYQRLGYEESCLGLPIADQEQTAAGGFIARFEHGSITLIDGLATASCTSP